MDSAQRPRTDELTAGIRGAVARIHRRVRAEMRAGELGETAVSTLNHLVRQGPDTPGALSVREQVSAPAMNQTVNALQAAGFVTRRPDPTDGRRILVEATDAGRTRATEMREAKNAWLRSRVERLSPADRAVLAEAARILDELASS